MSEGARRQLSSSAVAPPSMQQQPCERKHCVDLPQVMGYASAAKEEDVRGERTKSGAEIMTSQDGCRCEL